MTEVIEYLFSAILLVFVGVYAVLILLFRSGIKPVKSVAAPKATLPSLSLIIAFRNERKHIQSLIKNLGALDYPSGLLSVLLVDDHSEDGSYKLALKCIKELELSTIQLMKLPEGFHGKKTALHWAIQQQTSEWIVVSDADCRHSSAWLRSLMEETRDANCRLICGPVKMTGSSFLSHIFSLEFASLMASSEGAWGIGKPFLSNGANIAFKTTTYAALHEDALNKTHASGDDVFLLHAILAQFGSVAVAFAKAKDAIVETAAPERWKDFFSQRIRWASKARDYANFTAIITSWIVLLMNLSIALAYISAFFSHIIAISLCIAILIRAVSELALLRKALPFYAQNFLLSYYPVMLPFYPLYIIIAAGKGFTGSFSWKNRKLS